ncbi:hypothetical protein Plhal304r1_c001g0003501 [Plasmopara halstedii]
MGMPHYKRDRNFCAQYQIGDCLSDILLLILAYSDSTYLCLRSKGLHLFKALEGPLQENVNAIGSSSNEDGTNNGINGSDDSDDDPKIVTLSSLAKALPTPSSPTEDPVIVTR